MTEADKCYCDKLDIIPFYRLLISCWATTGGLSLRSFANQRCVLSLDDLACPNSKEKLILGLDLCYCAFHSP